jgi:glycosyltransferase involved in cell wall biosynthesis
MAKPILLAVATMPPWPITNGYALRVYHVLLELAAHWRIVLIAPTAALPAPLADVLSDYLPVSFKGRWGSLPSQFDTGPLQEAAEHAVAAWKPQAALLWQGAEFLGFAPRFPPTVADRIDSLTLASWRSRHHAGTKRLWLSALGAVGAYAAYERRVVRAFPTVVVGEDDARALRRLTGSRTVHVIPNGVAAPPDGDRGEGAVPMVAFTGVLDYPPNVDAVCHFARAVWPGIRAAVPGARFVIAGLHPLPEVRALAREAGVEVRADVPDMYSVLREAWVTVAPMMCGSGIKNKVLEAWAAGRPVAMTTIATNGLALTPDAQELVTDDSKTLGALIVDLLQQPERRWRLGAAVREQVARQHRWADAAARLSALLLAASRVAAAKSTRAEPLPRLDMDGESESAHPG